MAEVLKLMLIFIKIGLFSFGGGYAMIPLIRSELVTNGLMTFNEVADIVAVSQMTPGPFAINAATFAGVKTAGIIGGIAATFAVMLPSFVISIIAAKFFIKYQDNFYVKNTFEILRPAVTGLIASAAIAMIAPVIFNATSFFAGDIAKLLGNADITALIIAAASCVAVIAFKAPPIPVILAAGAAGIIFYAVI